MSPIKISALLGAFIFRCTTFSVNATEGDPPGFLRFTLPANSAPVYLFDMLVPKSGGENLALRSAPVYFGPTPWKSNDMHVYYEDSTVAWGIVDVLAIGNLYNDFPEGPILIESSITATECNADGDELSDNFFSMDSIYRMENGDVRYFRRVMFMTRNATNGWINRSNMDFNEPAATPFDREEQLVKWRLEDFDDNGDVDLIIEEEGNPLNFYLFDDVESYSEGYYKSRANDPIQVPLFIATGVGVDPPSIDNIGVEWVNVGPAHDKPFWYVPREWVEIPLEEYAFNNSKPMISVGRDRVFQVEYLRRKGPELSYALQLSTDLSTWLSGNLPEVVQDLGNGWERVFTSYVPPGFAKTGYARVAVKRN